MPARKRKHISRLNHNQVVQRIRISTNSSNKANFDSRTMSRHKSQRRLTLPFPGPCSQCNSQLSRTSGHPRPIAQTATKISQRWLNHTPVPPAAQRYGFPPVSTQIPSIFKGKVSVVRHRTKSCSDQYEIPYRHRCEQRFNSSIWRAARCPPGWFFVQNSYHPWHDPNYPEMFSISIQHKSCLLPPTGLIHIWQNNSPWQVYASGLIALLSLRSTQMGCRSWTNLFSLLRQRQFHLCGLPRRTLSGPKCLSKIVNGQKKKTFANPNEVLPYITSIVATIRTMTADPIYVKLDQYPMGVADFVNKEVKIL